MRTSILKRTFTKRNTAILPKDYLIKNIMEHINNLTWCDFRDTKVISRDYSRRTIPKATPENMVVLMDKINELAKLVNELSKN